MTRTNGRTNGSGAEQSRTTLRFFGKAQGVKVNIPKGGYSGESGSVDITFRVSAPEGPKDPSRYRNDWNIHEARKTIGEYGGVRPDPEEDKKGAAAFDKAQKTLAAELNRHRIEDERYARDLAEHGPALMAYAQLVGLMAVFSDQRLEITLAPAGQDLLPGMGVMLALPDSKAAARDDEDLDEYHDDDYDEDEEDLVDAAEMVAQP